MTTTISLKIRPEFREPLRSGIGFKGRERELRRLENLFEFRNSGTILIAGDRGVGKSALVDEALRRVNKRTNHVVVRLTLAHLRSGSAALNNVSEQVLRSLARGLHFAIKDDVHLSKEAKSKAEALYSKTYLTSLQEQIGLGSVVAAETKEVVSDRRETTWIPSKALTLILGVGAYTGLGVAGAKIVSDIGAQHGAGWAIGAAATIASVSALAAWQFRKERTRETTARQTVSKVDSSTRTGTWDLSQETLEFELRQVVEQLREDRRPCVFVIDELDKLQPTRTDEESPGLEASIVFKIVAGLKNFFTLGSAKFVFIVGSDFYSDLLAETKTGAYTTAHTLFTDRMFVHILHYKDMEALIDAMLVEPSTDGEVYRQFRNFLCWESANHVFDLLSLVGEYVSPGDGPNLELRAQEAGPEGGRWREGNLPSNWRVASALQKFVGAAYDESFRPSSREELFNQALWLELRRTASELLEGKSFTVPEKGYELPGPSRYSDVGPRDVDDLAGAAERFLRRLERYGAANGRSHVETRTLESGETQEERITTYSLAENPPYPSASVAAEGIRLPIEDSLLDLGTQVSQQAENLRGFGVPLDEEDTELASLKALTGQVSDTSPRLTVPRSAVRKGLQRANELAGRLIRLGTRYAVTSWATNNGAVVSSSLDESEPRTGVQWRETLNEFRDLISFLDAGRERFEYLIVGVSSSENQILVVLDFEGESIPELSKAFGRALKGEKGRQRRKQRLPLVAVTLEGSARGAEIPDEVFEVIREASGFLGWLRKRVERKVGRLAGWTLFPLNATLGNLTDLEDALQEASFLDVSSSPDADEEEGQS